MKIAVSSASGLEAVVKRELSKLGIENAPAVNGRAIFDGDENAVMQCNLFLRSASRVFIVLSEFAVRDFDTLFDGVYAIDWKEFLTVDAKIVVEAKCVRSEIHAVSATQSVVKKAICKKLMKEYGALNLPENGARYKVEISILKDVCTVSLDTSGEGLHRRGYRNLVGDAPLKENVAAALIELSVWNPSRPFADLFCGSGTLPIEAALIAKGVPSGINRDFDFLHWKGFDAEHFEEMKSASISRLNDVSNVKISGFDIDGDVLKLARKHARNAGVEDLIHFQRMNMTEFSSHLKRGVIISNPPYGERLSERSEIEKIYVAYGKLRQKFDDWCFYTITPVKDFEKLFGGKANKKRKIYNGSIECCYYSYLAKQKKDSDR